MYILSGLRHRRKTASGFPPRNENPALHTQGAQGSAGYGSMARRSHRPRTSATVGENAPVFTMPFASLGLVDLQPQ